VTQYDMTTPEFMTVDEFSARFGVSRATVYRLLAGHKIDARKVGRKTAITTASAHDWARNLPAFRSRSGESHGSQR
jgi:excisionase family DNA binding protein